MTVTWRWNSPYTVPSGKVIQFPNVADVAKINLYSTTFGIGITSGSLTMFASSTHRFRQNSVSGTEWAYIDATCAGGRVLTSNYPGPRTTSNVTWASGFSGTMDFHVTPTAVWMRMTGVSRNANTAMAAQTKICDYPSGVPAPPGASTTGWRFAIPVHNASFDMGNNTQHQGATLHLDGTAVWVIPTGDVLYDADVLDAVISWPRG